MSHRRGFTVVELMAGLVVASIVLIALHRVSSALFDALERTAEARRQLDSRANARRLLSAAAAGIEVSPAWMFVGRADEVTFSSWVATEREWPERKRITIRRAGGDVVLDGLYDQPIALAHGVTGFVVEYFPPNGSPTRWMRGWTSALVVPLALRLHVISADRADTIVVASGARS